MNKKTDYKPFNGYKKIDTFDKKMIAKAIKFSCNDLEIAHGRMRKAGYENFSTFGRDCILHTEIVERITQEQMKMLNELIRERNNLNQIAIACNRGQCWSVANATLALIKRMDGIIDRFNQISPKSCSEK